jgi:hypothetical protein
MMSFPPLTIVPLPTLRGENPKRAFVSFSNPLLRLDDFVGKKPIGESQNWALSILPRICCQSERAIKHAKCQQNGRAQREAQEMGRSKNGKKRAECQCLNLLKKNAKKRSSSRGRRSRGIGRNLQKFRAFLGVTAPSPI